MKKRDRVLSTVLLFTGLAHSLQAKTFKVGDYVEAKTVGNATDVWEPCTVSRPMVRNQYRLDCGPIGVFLEPRFIRLRAATAEDKRVEAETAEALARQPRPGNSLGAKYGTREPVTCANRTTPAKGPPSPEQARQYFICEQEGDGITFINLIANVKLQVAPASHPPNPGASYPTAPDLNQPAWDIRGSFTKYECTKPPKAVPTLDTVTDFARTHTCTAVDELTATGYCYKDNFGDWHCPMWQRGNQNANPRPYQLPPAGN